MIEPQNLKISNRVFANMDYLANLPTVLYSGSYCVYTIVHI